MKKKTVKAWVIIGPRNLFLWFTIQPTRKQAMERLHDAGGIHWFNAKKTGYSMRPITITWEE